MTILVTGATGDLGFVLVRLLQAEGRQVRVLSRRPFMASDLFADAVETVEWHPDVDPLPREAVDGVTAVVHLMGEPLLGRGDAGKLARIEASRAMATQRLTEAFAGRAWRLIVASMVPVSSDPQDVLTDMSPRHAQWQPIEQAMLGAEAAAQAARSAGASVAIVRFGLLLSSDGAIGALCRLARLGIQPAMKGALIPAIDIADAASMLAGLIDRVDIEGPINAVAPLPLSGADLARLLARVRSVPTGLALRGGGLDSELGALQPLLHNRARIVPQRLAELGARFENPDPAAFLDQIIAGKVRVPSRWRAWLPMRLGSRTG